jgi:hypothetical protein
MTHEAMPEELFMPYLSGRFVQIIVFFAYKAQLCCVVSCVCIGTRGTRIVMY